MTAGVFLAVLGAAALHAAWNAIIKSGTSRAGAMAILSVWEIVVGAGLALPQGLPGAPVLPWLAASALFHLIYKTGLTFAYDRGDLSRVYPLARGTAPLAVLVIGVLVLGEGVGALEAAGILVLGAGILTLAAGALRGENRGLVPFALLAAVGTAGYTLVDGLGARVSGAPGAYVAWLFVLDGASYLALMAALRGRRALPPVGADWAWGALGGAASWGAYAIAVWAMTVAPIPLVAALRETSILFAVLIGRVLFGEPITPGKAAALALVLAGLALTRL